jgi:hypothetical protein
MNWDYIAGLFDGEGCVHFIKKSKRYKLDISNTDEKTIDSVLTFLRKNISENIKKYSYTPYGYKTIFRIVIINQKDVINFCEYLSMRCITKKYQLEEALNYEINTYHTRRKRWSNEEKDYVINNYKKRGDVIKISKELNRTWASVENEVERLNLRKIII